MYAAELITSAAMLSVCGSTIIHLLTYSYFLDTHSQYNNSQFVGYTKCHAEL